MKVENFYKIRKYYLCLVVVYAILREIVPLNFLISSSFVSLGILLIGGLVALLDLLSEKNLLKTKNIYILIGFCVICIASAIINMKYGVIDNIKTLGILFVYFFVLYPYGATRDKEMFERDLITVFKVYNIALGFFVFLSLIMYVFNVGYIVDYLDAYSQGFSAIYGRLWGVFSEANCAAVYALVGSVTSAWLYTKSNKRSKRIYWLINIVFDTLFMILAISRTAKLVFAICVFWMALVYFWFKAPKGNGVKRIAVLVLAPIVASAGFYGFVKVSEFALPRVKYVIQITPIYDSTDWYVHKAYDSLYTKVGCITVLDGIYPDERPQKQIGDDGKEIKEEPVIIELERTAEDQESASYSRLIRWKHALEIYKSSPIIGVSARNVIPYAKVNNPSTLMATMDMIVHNSYLDILVGTGTIGMLVFCLFFVLSIVMVIRVTFKEFSFTNLMLSVAMMIVAMAGFFHEDLFFIFRLGGVILWMILGYFALQYNDSKKGTDEL